MSDREECTIANPCQECRRVIKPDSPPQPGDTVLVEAVDCRCRYLCERCGGSGVQEQGSYDHEVKSYTGKAGQCQLCGGEGYLGYIVRQDDREAFERWYEPDPKLAGKALERKLNGGYRMIDAANRWETWQAAIKHASAIHLAPAKKGEAS